MSTDPSTNAFYIDYSMFSTYLTCPELYRLQYAEHLRAKVTAPALDFGSAFHKALETWRLTGSTASGEAAFIQYCIDNRAALPISIHDDEKRSVERGLAIFNGYVRRWANELYDIYIDPNGKPFVEVPFRIYLGDWAHKGSIRPTYLVGRIDMIVRSRTTGKLYNWETKTTSMGLSNFQRHARPNHQITIYEMALRDVFGLEVAGTVWDMIFISSRKPSPKHPLGIDIDNDYARVETRRTERHFAKLLQDICDTLDVILSREPSVLWPQNMPKACYMYGGCPMLSVCDSHHNPDLISTNFEVKPWEPWKTDSPTDSPMEPVPDATPSAPPSGSPELGG